MYTRKKSTVRSIIEFCSPVYSAMLNQGQVERLENLQAKVTRIIWGPQVPRDQRLHNSSLEPLADRRKKRCAKFAKTCLDSSRYNHWFPPHENTCQMSLRNKPIVQEFSASTNRRYTSPLFYLRRVLTEVPATDL